MWKLRFCCIILIVLPLENNFGPSSRIYGLQAVISQAKSKQTIEGDLCGLAKMATNASTQEQGLRSEDQIVYLPTSGKEKSPALEEEIAGQGDQKDAQKEIEGFETGSTVSTKIQTLRNNKKSAKTRLTKAKNHLKDLLENQPPGTGLPRKNTIRRGINKV